MYKILTMPHYFKTQKMAAYHSNSHKLEILHLELTRGFQVSSSLGIYTFVLVLFQDVIIALISVLPMYVP